jgi:hypothetical protein
MFYSADGSAPPESLVGNTAQALLAPDFGLIQHGEALAAGVSVTWIVARALPGAGPLMVEMEWSGLVHTGQGPDGHHFADTRGAGRWRFGNVTVVDSGGRRWAAETRAESGHLRVEVPEAALTDATYPLAIDPLLGPEFVMAAPGLTPTYGISPALAAGASNYLVVWEDYRHSSPSVSHADIYGARVGTNGVLLDRAGFAICTATNNQTAPAVAANGTDYLVVWEDQRDGPATNIYGARVNGVGVLLDTNGFAISTAINIQSRPALAARGSDYLVVWEDGRGGASSDIFGARVTSAGVVADPFSIPICTAANVQAGPAVASNGTNWLVVWHDLRAGERYNIYGARVNAAGTVIETGGFPVSSNPEGHSFPAVASNGTNYFVVWADGRGGFQNSDIYGTRVNTAGVVSDPAGIPICTAPQTQYYPSVAYAQNRYHRDMDRLPERGRRQCLFSGCLCDARQQRRSSWQLRRHSYQHELSRCRGRGESCRWGWQFPPALAWRGRRGVRHARQHLRRSARPRRVHAHLRPRRTMAASSRVERERLSRRVGRNAANVWLWGTRVTRAGSCSIRLAWPFRRPRFPAGYPALAANGGDFLILWSSAGARVTSAGVVVR